MNQSDCLNKILQGDNLDVMREMPSNSVDLIVTDPPFGLSFMGANWDKAVPPVEVWKECLRILKPGAFAFVMSIPRQDCQAKMILNLQEAGFDISFSPIVFAFAQGFPKAQNVGKLVDRRLGMEREVVEERHKGKHGGGSSYQWSEMDNETGVAHITKPATPESEVLAGSYSNFSPKPAYECILVCMKPFADKHKRSDVYRMLGGKYDYWYTQRTVITDRNIDKQVKKWSRAFEEGDIIERRLALYLELQDEVILNRKTILWSKPYKDTDITSSVTHALATGKGISWLDSGRIPYDETPPTGSGKPGNKITDINSRRLGNEGNVTPLAGRFAPNLLVQDDILNDGTNHKSGSGIPGMGGGHPSHVYGDYAENKTGRLIGDSGSFSRFFDLDAWAKKYLPENIDKTFPFVIVPKPSKSQKNAGLDELPDKQMYKCDNSGESLEIFGTTDGGRKPRKNNHATVKNISLMAYLISIGSREGDFVYDPYSGSCTTACASVILKRDYGGAELDPEYCDIGRRRIAYWKDNPHKLTTKKRKKEQPKVDELTLF